MIAVNITDTLTPHHRQVVGTLASTRPLMARLGKTLEVALKRHFERLQSRPNKRGWPKKNFWTQVKRSTALNNIQEREAAVAISDPRFALHLYGGTVRAKRARMLAVPITADAYAAGSPRERLARRRTLAGRSPGTLHDFCPGVRAEVRARHAS